VWEWKARRPDPATRSSRAPNIHLPGSSLSPRFQNGFPNRMSRGDACPRHRCGDCLGGTHCRRSGRLFPERRQLLADVEVKTTPARSRQCCNWSVMVAEEVARPAGGWLALPGFTAFAECKLTGNGLRFVSAPEGLWTGSTGAIDTNLHTAATPSNVMVFMSWYYYILLTPCHLGFSGQLPFRGLTFEH